MESSKEMTLEQKLLGSIEQSIIRQINQSDLVAIQYSDKMRLPAGFMLDAWGLIDQDALLKSLAARLQEELVERLVNQLAAEIATDIKQVLSDKERREAVRAVVRDNIEKLTGRK
jgi:hypothetical protein